MTGPATNGELVNLCPFAERHLTDRYVSWLNDPEVVRFSEQRHRVHTLQSCRVYWESFTGSSDMFWAIEARDQTLGHIGNLTATIDDKNSVADLAIMIGEPIARGHGMGTDAWRAACSYLFNEAGIRKVTAGTMSCNKAMVQVMEHSGMTIEGVRRGQFLLDGKEIDMVLAAVFREQWQD